MIENLRLIKRPGINRWSEQNKRWSEIAIGQDIDSNIIICSSVWYFCKFNKWAEGY